METYFKEKYDPKQFRSVKRGIYSTAARCLHCRWHDESATIPPTNLTLTRRKARAHAKKTNHTVNYYQENCTQYTCVKRKRK